MSRRAQGMKPETDKAKDKSSLATSKSLSLSDLCTLRTDWFPLLVLTSSLERKSDFAAGRFFLVETEPAFPPTDATNTKWFVIEHISGYGVDDDNRPLF